VLTDAPDGLESIVRVASVDGKIRSKLGRLEDTDEQPASAQPNITAKDARVVSISILLATIHGFGKEKKERGSGLSVEMNSTGVASLQVAPSVKFLWRRRDQSVVAM